MDIIIESLFLQILLGSLLGWGISFIIYSIFTKRFGVTVVLFVHIYIIMVGIYTQHLGTFTETHNIWRLNVEKLPIILIITSFLIIYFNFFQEKETN